MLYLSLGPVLVGKLFVWLLTNHLTFGVLIYKVRGWVGFSKIATLSKTLWVCRKIPFGCVLIKSLPYQTMPLYSNIEIVNIFMSSLTECKTEVLVIRLNLPCSRTFTVQYSRIELHIFSMFSPRSEKWQRFEKIWGLNHAGKLWNRWRRKHVNASILILRYYRNKVFYFLTISHKIKGTLYFHRE